MSYFDDPDYGKVVVASCDHCGAEFLGSRYDQRRRQYEEDSEPSRSKECDAPGCHVRMCPECQGEHVCDWCGKRYCGEHAGALVKYCEMKVCTGECLTESRAEDDEEESEDDES